MVVPYVEFNNIKLHQSVFCYENNVPNIVVRTCIRSAKSTLVNTADTVASTLWATLRCREETYPCTSWGRFPVPRICHWESNSGQTLYHST